VAERIDRSAGVLRRLVQRHPDNGAEVQIHGLTPAGRRRAAEKRVAAHERGWKTGLKKPAQPKLAPPGAAIDERGRCA
jgi:hypothetical protein